MHPILVTLSLLASGFPTASSKYIGQLPEQCGEDASLCLIYCRTIDPGTVHARCGWDRISCVCINGNGQSMKVRFVQEREPVPFSYTTSTTTKAPTTMTPTPTTEQPQPPTPAFDYDPAAPVPVLLECDTSPEANSVCYQFCTIEVYAHSGACDLGDKTCKCEGVSSAVVQPAPIPVVYDNRGAVAVQGALGASTPTPPEQSSFWTPITPGHPNYHGPFIPPPPPPQQQAFQENNFQGPPQLQYSGYGGYYFAPQLLPYPPPSSSIPIHPQHLQTLYAPYPFQQQHHSAEDYNGGYWNPLGGSSIEEDQQHQEEEKMVVEEETTLGNVPKAEEESSGQAESEAVPVEDTNTNATAPAPHTPPQ